MRHYLLTPLLVVSLFTSAYCQDETKPEKPKTKLESFLGQDGVVIVQGFSTIGIVKGMFNSSVSVDSKEILSVTSGRKEYGITIEVKKLLGSSTTRENTSYVDYDEIESLIKGIDYISKVNKSSIKLDDFQADYSTKGDLKLSVYSGSSASLFGSSNSSTIYFNVRSGTIGSVSATFKQEDIVQVRDLIVKAKEKLDKIKQ